MSFAPTPYTNVKIFNALIWLSPPEEGKKLRSAKAQENCSTHLLWGDGSVMRDIETILSYRVYLETKKWWTNTRHDLEELIFANYVSVRIILSFTCLITISYEMQGSHSFLTNFCWDNLREFRKILHLL